MTGIVFAILLSVQVSEINITPDAGALAYQDEHEIVILVQGAEFRYALDGANGRMIWKAAGENKFKRVKSLHMIFESEEEIEFSFIYNKKYKVELKLEEY